jgi:D-glycero-D-manno-heptose 1,7-bisphosphate phosphatase
MTDGTRPGVFLDRDGTLIEDSGYLHRPEDVRLLPGAARAVARLNAAGYAVVVVTNQSGIARGLYDVAAYQAVQGRLAHLLAAAGARLDGAYYCPHHPDHTGPCACRKPGVRLFEEAARSLGLDLHRSWFVGDRAGDVIPARALGGRGLLVATGEGPAHAAAARAEGVPVVADLAAAADHILGA